MKPRLTDDIKREINIRIKNKVDIADLIENYSIDCEDFTGAVITRFNREGENISNLVLTNAVVGNEESGVNINRVIATNCCFKGVKFIGQVMAKNARLNNSNFMNAYVPRCDYRYADLRGCNFCGTIFTIATSYSFGAKFDDKFFHQLGDHFGLEIKVKGK